MNLYSSTNLSHNNIGRTIKPLFDVKNECGITYVISDTLTNINFNIPKDPNLIFANRSNIMFGSKHNDAEDLVNFEIICCNKQMNDIVDTNTESTEEIDEAYKKFQDAFLHSLPWSSNSEDMTKSNTENVPNKSENIKDISLKAFETKKNDKNKTAVVHNQPLYLNVVVTKYKEGFVLNDTFFIKFNNWNGLVVSGSSRYLCVLCDYSLPKRSTDVHVNTNVYHLEAFSNRCKYILAEFGDDLITWISKQDRYHCPLCNHIMKKHENILKHCKSRYHQLKLLSSKSKCRNVLEEMKNREDGSSDLT